MEEQPSLFDLPGERAARDEAMFRVAAHAEADWTTRARAAVEHVARSQPEMCSDDVWRTGLEKPREARALGPVMRWAAQRGLVVRTATFRQSAQAGCHAMDVRVWRSLVYKS
jgi:hypothetical protein